VDITADRPAEQLANVISDVEPDDVCHRIADLAWVGIGSAQEPTTLRAARPARRRLDANPVSLVIILQCTHVCRGSARLAQGIVTPFRSAVSCSVSMVAHQNMDSPGCSPGLESRYVIQHDYQDDAQIRHLR
jgi:hypothetical protein